MVQQSREEVSIRNEADIGGKGRPQNTIIDKCSAVIISIAVSIVGQQKYLK
jgi:hypothetical protein